MKVPDIPQDEQARLHALRALNVLDTPQEERFDRLTRLAIRMFGVPIALVSLVDENRQWFKSCVGLSASETSRDISFCGHAILGDDVFLIPNATEDIRFADNPLVTNDPHIRFYAGCPLIAPNGFKLGTLCIIDTSPRDFGKDDIEALKDLAAMVEHELAAIHQATMDELTGISNRRGFIMLAKQSLPLCTRLNIPATLIFLDLDKFKPINDQFGHAEGDLALTQFANLLKMTCRDSDVFARLGGDEFVVLLTNASKQQAEEIIAKFRLALAKYNQSTKRGYEILFSCGIVEFSHDTHRNIEQLLIEGDAMMFEAKRSKR